MRKLSDNVRAVASLVDARDALPADNLAIAPPTKVRT